MPRDGRPAVDVQVPAAGVEPDERADVALVVAVPDDRLLDGRDQVVGGPGNLAESEAPRRSRSRVDVLAEPEDRRALRGRVAADSLEDADPVVKAGRQEGDRRLRGVHELPVHPDGLRLDGLGGHGVPFSAPSRARSRWRRSCRWWKPRRRIRAAEGPRSERPAARTFSTARSTASASAGSARPCLRSIAAEAIAPIGFATSFPASAGAEPCTGSKRPGPSPRLATGGARASRRAPRPRRRGCRRRGSP